ncbi:MAG TPA: PaaI family thioesterase [Thermoanaerobaculia bacterium]|nr:PaaI family thioesterase [Thermoanaerobaculia bacterium]
MSDARPFVDAVRKMMSGEAPPAPIAETIGMIVSEIGPDFAVFEMDTARRHANPMGTLHGGVLCDLADGAMGMAWASELTTGETFTTLELKINFLKPVWETHLRAEARVVKRGRTVGLVACDVRDAKGELVAHATSTLMTLRGEQAKGR